MKVILIPFGSFLFRESRDQDFVAFKQTDLENLEFPDSVCIETEAWDRDEVARAARAAGVVNPDIWLCDDEGDMKPIIVANLAKDYPKAADKLQEIMGLMVNIQGSDVNLLCAMEANVVRWQGETPHLPNLRKRVFSRIQRDAYNRGFGFWNTKSEIAKIAEKLGYLNVQAFLLGIENETDYSRDNDGSILDLLGLDEAIPTYASQYGAIMELPVVFAAWGRTYLTPIGVEDGKTLVLFEEVYTYQTNQGVIGIENDVWQKLLDIDLKEVER